MLNLNHSLFKGKLVRLAAHLQEDHAIVASWSNNDEYLRLADDDPARPSAPSTDAPGAPSHDSFGFNIRTLTDDRLIGQAGLFNIKWTHRTVMLGMVIGEPEFWGKGYGSDALNLLVGYAFRELNLYRVGLEVMSYNLRAVRCYEKGGFVQEGIRRGAILREGQRFDSLQYGILYEEWQARQQ